MAGLSPRGEAAEYSPGVAYEALSDRELLTQFLAGEQEAFTALVQRHAGLVMSVCRRVLQRADDAEDAFQATFFVLARKAESISWQESIAAWLHQTARRTSLKSRALLLRRREVEQQAAQQGSASVESPAANPSNEAALRELGEILDAELEALAPRFREVILLSQAQGLTRDEMAERLGITVAMVKDRLERGREQLRTRLLSRGISLTAIAIAAWIAPGTAQAAGLTTLATSTSQAAGVFATGSVAAGGSSSAATLAHGVLKMMGFEKLRFVAVWLLSLMTAGGIAFGMLRDEPTRFTKGLRGHVVAVNVGPASTVTIALDEFDALLNLDILPEAKVWMAFEPGQLADLKKGQFISVRLASDHRTVNEIHIQGKTREAAIQSITPTGKIVISGDDDADNKGQAPQEIELAPDAILRVGGLPAARGDLKPGMEVPLEFGRDGKVVNAIEAEATDGAVIEGELLLIDPKDNRLHVRCGDDDEGRNQERALLINAETIVTVDGRTATSSDLKRGSVLTLRLADDGRSVRAIKATSPVKDDEDSAIRGAVLNETYRIAYPTSPAVVNVKQAPYHAKGDGVTDDTQAIQQALSDVMGQHKLLYFPNGTYLVSKTLVWSKKNSAGKDAWGKNFIQGENVFKTILRLKDGVSTDPKQPTSIMWCGGFGSADWFHNYVQDLTFDVGERNPAAIGLQFYSNNSGAVRNCRFVAHPGSGLVGLDLGHRDMNGPLLVRHCEIIGFQRGISTARAVNGQTFEHITLRGQTQFGFTNEGQAISVRGLVSDNSVPAIQTYGTFCLVSAKLTGRSEARRVPAIVNFNGGRIYLRDVHTEGYNRALGDVTTPDSAAAFRITGQDKPGSEGPVIVEYYSHPATSPFDSTKQSLRLAVEEPPCVPTDDPTTWANVDAYGADPTGQRDSSAAIQRAIDSGATTLFLPGSYTLQSTVVIRGAVRRLVGVGGVIDYHAKVKPDFRIVDGESPVVSLEHFAYIHGGLEIDTQRTVLLRSVADCDLTFTEKATGSRLFLEDVVTHNLRLNQQQVWARQLNVENEGTHVTNDRGSLWVLGYKTERGGTLLETRNGGRSEILGGFSYTTTAGKLAPMFVTNNASVFAFFGEVCFNGDPFETLIRETRGDETRVVKRGDGATSPYIAVPAGN